MWFNFNNAFKTRSDIFMEDCRHTHCIGSNLTMWQDRAADKKHKFVADILLKYLHYQAHMFETYFHAHLSSDFYIGTALLRKFPQIQIQKRLFSTILHLWNSKWLISARWFDQPAAWQTLCNG